MEPNTPSTHLHEERNTITRLLALLKQEQCHLIAADIDQLSALTPQKSLLVQQMAGLARQRHGALAAAGFAAGEAGMTDWIAAASDAAGAAIWHEVLNLTREAKEFNRLNGTLINKHMVHTRSVLNLLRPAPPSGNFYGPNGQSTSNPTNRGFVVG